MTRVLIGLAIVLWSTCVFGGSVPITTCGRVVFKGDRGILMADLDCGLKWGTCRLCTTCSDPVQPTVPCSSPADRVPSNDVEPCASTHSNFRWRWCETRLDTGVSFTPLAGKAIIPEDGVRSLSSRS